VCGVQTRLLADFDPQQFEAIIIKLYSFDKRLTNRNPVVENI